MEAPGHRRLYLLFIQVASYIEPCIQVAEYIEAHILVAAYREPCIQVAAYIEAHILVAAYGGVYTGGCI